MRIPRQDPVERALRDRGQVLLPKVVEETLFTDTPDVATGVALGIVEDPEVDAGVVKQAGERLGHELVARVERRVVADEPEDLRRLLANVLHLEAERPRPAGPLTARLPERVPRLVNRFERLLQRRIHVTALDEPAPHLVDDRDMLDPHRADLHTGHALHAGPERLRPDGVADDAGVQVVQRLDVQRVPEAERTLGDLAQVENQIAR